MDQFSEFAGNNLLLVVALMVSFFVLVFSELRRKASGLVAIDPTEAVGLINGDAAVLDLRSADSFALGHIVNARNIPMDDFDVTQSKVAGLKNKSVLAVCDSGTRSNKAVDQMRKSGFESVYGLKGGMAAWSQAGLPVVTGKKTKSKK
jgi:rhodanese-related sulfurtransferase